MKSVVADFAGALFLKGSRSLRARKTFTAGIALAPLSQIYHSHSHFHYHSH